MSATSKEIESDDRLRIVHKHVGPLYFYIWKRFQMCGFLILILKVVKDDTFSQLCFCTYSYLYSS